MDLTSLSAFLATLGPWGVLAGAGLTIVVQLVRKRLANKAPAPAPKPADPVGPTPAPVPLPSLPNRPVLDAALRLLEKFLNRKPLVGSDGSDVDDDLSADDFAKIVEIVKSKK